MRLLRGAKTTAPPAARPAGADRGLALLPLDLLSDILLDSLPCPASTSGHVDDDARQLVERTTRLAKLSRVCKTFKALLEGVFRTEVALAGSQQLYRFSKWAKKHKDDARRVKKLVYVDFTRSREDDLLIMDHYKRVFKFCTGIEVLCLVGAEVEVKLLGGKSPVHSLLLVDCLLQGSSLFIRGKPQLSNVRNITVDGCLYVGKAEDELLNSLSPESVTVFSFRRNYLYDYKAYTVTPRPDWPATSKSLPRSRLSFTLPAYLSSPTPLASLTHVALAIDCAPPPPLEAALLTGLRASPLRTIYLEDGAEVWWNLIHPELLVYAKAVRQLPETREAVPLLKGLVELFSSDASGEDNDEGRIFPELRRLVLPFSWGSDAVLEEYFDADLPYYLARLKGMLEARGVGWVVETAEEGSLWGRATYSWTKV
ncbi:hypothetical protein JCM10207_007464 [Rhodosporidiobolus poonsookiae]